MKLNKTAFWSILLLAAMALSGCKSEKKVASYEDLFKEQPVTILIAPVQDNTKRIQAKTSQDNLLNEELDAAAIYMQQTLSDPLAFQGYYSLAPLATDEVMKQVGKNYRELMLGDIKSLASDYGIDAVLLVALHRWQEPEVNEVVVYAEYTLRSTKSGLELMHTWVRGNKMQPVDHLGEPVELASDVEFIEASGFDSRLAHRCLLLQQMSDFVLRNLPTSISRWHFKHDQYIPSNPQFYGFTIHPDGSLERSEYSEDAFGNACFTD